MLSRFCHSSNVFGDGGGSVLQSFGIQGSGLMVKGGVGLEFEVSGSERKLARVAEEQFPGMASRPLNPSTLGIVEGLGRLGKYAYSFS